MATATVFSYSHGALFQHNSFVGGFRQVQFHLTDEDRKRHNALYELIAMIPPDASVAATEMEAPRVSARRFCFTMRVGHDDADFLLISLDEARAPGTKETTRAAIDSGKYGFVAVRERFVLWKRGYSQANNARGMKLLGIRQPHK